VKIKQYCSVCREELPMEVVPTENGEDDGVIWLRCPRCQGFLPKVGVALPPEGVDEDGEVSAEQLVSEAGTLGEGAEPGDLDETGEPGGTHAAAAPGAAPDEAGAPVEGGKGSPAVAGTAAETIPPEYEAMLAVMDASKALPYRPWSTYEVGDAIHHLAWDDCGVVVAKESLPGRRRVVKVYFEKNGVVRLIEAAREP
jgi:hypothetical protein